MSVFWLDSSSFYSFWCFIGKVLWKEMQQESERAMQKEKFKHSGKNIINIEKLSHHSIRNSRGREENQRTQGGT